MAKHALFWGLSVYRQSGLIDVNQPPQRCLALALVKLAAPARCDFILKTTRYLKLAVTHILAVSLEARSSAHWHCY
jgi:hypothetical protein